MPKKYKKKKSKESGGEKVMAEEVKKEEVKKEEVKAGPAGMPPQMPAPTADQMLFGAFQQRLNGVVTMMNDLFRDVKDIMAQKDKEVKK